MTPMTSLLWARFFFGVIPLFLLLEKDLLSVNHRDAFGIVKTLLGDGSNNRSKVSILFSVFLLTLWHHGRHIWHITASFTDEATFRSVLTVVDKRS